MVNTELLTSTIVFFALMILSAMPLHRAVKFLKGKTKFIKTVYVVLISGIVASAINYFFSVWAGLISLVFLIWIYRKAFALKWHKAFLVWVLQIALILASSIIVNLLLKAFFKMSLYFR